MIEKSIVTGEYGTYIAKKKKGIQGNLLAPTEAYIVFHLNTAFQF